MVRCPGRCEAPGNRRRRGGDAAGHRPVRVLRCSCARCRGRASCRTGFPQLRRWRWGGRPGSSACRLRCCAATGRRGSRCVRIICGRWRDIWGRSAKSPELKELDASRPHHARPLSVVTPAGTNSRSAARSTRFTQLPRYGSPSPARIRYAVPGRSLVRPVVCPSKLAENSAPRLTSGLVGLAEDPLTGLPKVLYKPPPS